MNIPHKIDLIKVELPTGAEFAEFAKELGSAENLGPTKSDLNPDALAADVQRLSKALVAITNQSWRIANAVVDQDSKEGKEELSAREIKKMNKALEGMIETLEELGIKSIDRQGEPFNVGLPDQVISEEPRDGISKEQIVRTIRPTIMWNQTMVQRGEIDIAIPAVKK